MLAGKTQCEIAEAMGKDAAWVSRSVKRIRADFSSVYVRPEARQMMDEHLAQLDSLYRQALQTAESAAGMAKISALRLAGELLTKRAEYQKSIGLLPDAEKLNAQDDEGPMIALRDLQQDFPREHLEEIIVTSASRIMARRNGTETPGSRKPASAFPVHPSESQAQPRIFGRRRVGN